MRGFYSLLCLQSQPGITRAARPHAKRLGLRQPSAAFGPASVVTELRTLVAPP